MKKISNKNSIIIKFDGGEIIINDFSKIEKFEINKDAKNVYDYANPIPTGISLSPKQIFIQTKMGITISLENIKKEKEQKKSEESGN